MNSLKARCTKIGPAEDIPAGTWVLVRLDDAQGSVNVAVVTGPTTINGSFWARRWRHSVKRWTGFVSVHRSRMMGKIDPNDKAIKRLVLPEDMRPAAPPIAPRPEAAMADPQVVRKDQYEGGIDTDVAGGTG